MTRAGSGPPGRSATNSFSRQKLGRVEAIACVRLKREQATQNLVALPWGQDRLLPLFLATLAIRQQNRTIRFRSAAEMLGAFGMEQSGT